MEEIEPMNARLDIKTLRKFPRPVAEMLTELVNKHGIRYRRQDANHVTLYPLLEGQESIKVSASRQAEQQLRYLEMWVAKGVTPVLMEQQLNTLSEPRELTIEATGDGIVVTRPLREPEVYVDVPDTVLSGEEEPMEEWKPFVEGYEPPEGWRWYVVAEGRSNERKSPVFITDGKVYTCTVCAAVFDQPTSVGGHTRLHTAGSPLTDEVRALSNTPEARAKAAETARRNNIKRWLGEIAGEMGIDLGDPKQTKRLGVLEAQVEDLEARLAKVTTERDELQARLDLMKEVLS